MMLKSAVFYRFFQYLSESSQKIVPLTAKLQQFDMRYLQNGPTLTTGAVDLKTHVHKTLKRKLRRLYQKSSSKCVK